MPEYKLKQEVASVLGLPEFDEAAFREQVDYISVPANNEMVFHFHDGRVLRRHWDNTGYLDAWTEERRRRKSEFMKKENARRREAKKDGKG